ncbi:MAG TPA: signal peptidase I [Bacillales bacterium]|nr:signal peptidase I [Bacillales bacterium]
MKLRKTMKWVSRVTSTVLFVLLLLMIFMVISSRAAGGNPSLFGYQLKTVLSGSMEPGIQTGSIIAVKPVKETKQFEKGDVITFKTRDEKLVTHRVYKVLGSGTQYVTKGDNNEDPDPNPVLSQNIVAKYTGFTIPYVGYLVHYANTQGGTAVMLILPGVILLLYSGISIWKAVREIEGKTEKKTPAG